ncbi:hypothetical protein SLEP1_g48652 [Rubroshorea leprosula]|uniref:Uncharacterized protein n=1 Tax=Rubroshorea leprosula TaxID=152421 RepID=A0AAV5LWD0_9ROSI|nr:hypothetical protein SLEP1_g48652 [Rubroshorea leprosula]
MKVMASLLEEARFNITVLITTGILGGMKSSVAKGVGLMEGVLLTLGIALTIGANLHARNIIQLRILMNTMPNKKQAADSLPLKKNREFLDMLYSALLPLSVGFCWV